MELEVVSDVYTSSVFVSCDDLQAVSGCSNPSDEISTSPKSRSSSSRGMPSGVMGSKLPLIGPLGFWGSDACRVEADCICRA